MLFHSKVEICDESGAPLIRAIEVQGDMCMELQEETLAAEIKTLEADTGIKLRLLAQSYPETPGNFQISTSLSQMGDAGLEF